MVNMFTTLTVYNLEEYLSRSAVVKEDHKTCLADYSVFSLP